MAKKTETASATPVIITLGAIFLWPFLVAYGIATLTENDKVRGELVIAGLAITAITALTTLFMNMSLYTSIGVVVGIISLIVYFLNIDISDVYNN